jgi:EAL domain-containing protein (putative c-di-GMP-specific phosphodiesterase class I)
LELTGRTVVGVEALVRVLDDTDELIGPDAFRDVAEEIGLMVPIDEVVRAQALSHAHEWVERTGETGFAVALNVTARQLADVEFPRSLLAALAEAQLEPHRLQLEVTERVLLQASPAALQGLQSLRDAGVHVGLDDFGTGYSSLTCLGEFPVDVLKIDRSVVCALDTSPLSVAIVSAIVSVASALDITVVAEGVETRRQLEILELLGCHRAQGYLLAPSLSLAELDAFLAVPPPQRIPT